MARTTRDLSHLHLVLPSDRGFLDPRELAAGVMFTHPALGLARIMDAVCKIQNKQASSAAFVKSDPVPSGKIWLVLSLGAHQDSGSTDNLWFSMEGPSGLTAPLSKQEAIQNNSRHAILPGIPIPLREGYFIQANRSLTTNSIYLRFVYLDLTPGDAYPF